MKRIATTCLGLLLLGGANSADTNVEQAKRRLEDRRRAAATQPADPTVALRNRLRDLETENAKLKADNKRLTEALAKFEKGKQDAPKTFQSFWDRIIVEETTAQQVNAMKQAWTDWCGGKVRVETTDDKSSTFYFENVGDGPTMTIYTDVGRVTRKKKSE